MGLWYFRQCSHLPLSEWIPPGKSAFEQLFVDDTKRDGFSQFSFAACVLYMVKAGDEINASLQDT